MVRHHSLQAMMFQCSVCQFITDI